MTIDTEDYDRIYDKALLVRAEERIAAAYERGLRRGMAIAREWEQPSDDDVAWRCAREQMEREIEEAKR